MSFHKILKLLLLDFVFKGSTMRDAMGRYLSPSWWSGTAEDPKQERQAGLCATPLHTITCVTKSTAIKPFLKKWNIQSLVFLMT